METLTTIEQKSLKNKLYLEQFFLKEATHLHVTTGVKQVKKVLTRAPQTAVVVVLWTEVQPAYKLDQIKQLAVKLGVPLFFTPSPKLLTSLAKEKHSAICGVIQSANAYDNFQQYRVG